MIKIIKRGGFREQTARQLKYKDSVNQRTNLDAPLLDQAAKNLSVIDKTNQNKNDSKVDEHQLNNHIT